MQDQVTYPLTTALLGIPGVQTVRSTSMFGMSFIYIIFKDNVEFYWSRSRILEKLSSLPAGTLPTGVQPTLGPDVLLHGGIPLGIPPDLKMIKEFSQHGASLIDLAKEGALGGASTTLRNFDGFQRGVSNSLI